jgi:S1-C subfamily serine protease
MNRNVLKWIGIGVVLVFVLGLIAVGVVGAAYAARQASQASAAPAQQATATPAAKPSTSEAGIVITHVAADSPAAQAGLQRGDILLKINDTAVNSYKDLVSALADLKAGDRVTLTITRGGVEQTLTATLGEKNGRPYLGIEVCAGRPGRFWLGFTGRGPGALITSVAEGSPAEAAGLQVGDRILAVDGTTVDATNTLATLLSAHKPGDTVTLRVARPGEGERDVTVTLGDKDGKAYLGVSYVPFGWPKFIPLPEGVNQGVLVVSVAEDSPAAKAGVQVGDVITEVDGQVVATPRALSDAIAAHKPGDQITLKVYRPADGQTLDIQVTLAGRPDDASKAYLGISTHGPAFRGWMWGRGGVFRFGPFRFSVPGQVAPSVPGNET